MKGDFTRDTFHQDNHFSRVLQQQGRVHLDADANEQTAILLHYLRTLAADLIGPFAGPVLSDGKIGFTIGDPYIANDNVEFSIGKGRYYVDGILCENDNDITYQTQSNYPNSPLSTLDKTAKYLVYLDVWERHITYIDDDSIRESALGGPDTASRAEVVSQVKLQLLPTDMQLLSYGDGGISINLDNLKTLVEQWQPPSSGCLKARIKPPDNNSAPCLPSPDAKYSGPENQLYRVEIHASSTAATAGNKAKVATFKWSRDNGSVVTRILDGTFTSSQCTVEFSRGFDKGIWVELINDEQELRGEPGVFAQLSNVENNNFTFASPVSPPSGLEKWPTKVRRWDQFETKSLTLTEGAVQITEGTGEINWIDLEDGLQIQFQPGATQYRSGDYWLIPARVATRDIEWPIQRESSGKAKIDPNTGNELPYAKPPFGIRHHYAPLALLMEHPDNYPLWSATSLQISIPQPLQLGGYKIASYGEDGIGGPPSCDPQD